MTSQCLLVVDIGGTTYSSLYIDLHTLNYVSSCRSFASSESVASFLGRVLAQAPSTHQLTKKVIGLPGDTTNIHGHDFLFCPPLGYSINIHQLRIDDWVVVNDTIANAFFSIPISLRKLTSPIYLATLGTSFGFARIDSPSSLFNFDFSGSQSFEFAHHKISHYSFLLESLSYFPFTRIPHFVHQIFSVGGLSNCLGLTVNQDPNQFILRGCTHEILEHLPSPVTTKLFTEWTRLLHLFFDCHIHVQQKGMPTPVIVSGGLSSALRSTNFWPILANTIGTLSTSASFYLV